MEMFDSVERMFGGAGLIVFSIFFFVWAVLVFLSPFFLYGISKRAREAAVQNTATHKLLGEIRDALAPLAATPASTREAAKQLEKSNSLLTEIRDSSPTG